MCIRDSLGALKGVDVLFALAKVHGLVGVLQDKVVGVLLPVVFVVVPVSYTHLLNVWAGNTSAEHFYEKMGMKTKERQMEYIL